MSLPKRHAFSAWAGLLGGALSVAEGILILSKPGYYDYDSPLDYLVLVVEGAALLVLLAALSGLHARLATGYGRAGTAGFFAALAGTALAGAGHVGAVPFFDFLNTGGMVYPLFALKQGVFLFGGLAYVAGAILMSTGYLLLGAAAARAGGLPAWCGFALVAGLAGLWLGNAAGWISFGLAWAFVGYALRSSGG
ncbi:MAG: hypothetical protein M3R38_31850 [Actinomycetota bacterium]|nr:hypothetical protein [Actinomycetota bacterium]